ncbi:MAG: metalloregulator ArsR/SmtB family transcription factor [Bacteroidota bacterium]
MRIRNELKGSKISPTDIRMAEIANALAHPVRVALVRYLSEKDTGKGLDNNTCNKELVNMFDYSQSTISQHVKILCDCGLFRVERKDQFRFYFLNRELLAEYESFIKLI